MDSDYTKKAGGNPVHRSDERNRRDSGGGLEKADLQLNPVELG